MPAKGILQRVLVLQTAVVEIGPIITVILMSNALAHITLTGGVVVVVVTVM